MLTDYVNFPMEWGGYADQVNTVGGSIITSMAGGRPDPFTGLPSWHTAVDLVPKNLESLLYTVVDMRIYQMWDEGGGGNWSRGEATRTLEVFGYGHAARDRNVQIRPYATYQWGEKLDAGTPIAVIGTSGRSTGIHVHFGEKSTSVAAWGDPYPALLRTAQARRYPGVVPLPPPIIPFPPEAVMNKKLTILRDVKTNKHYVVEEGGFFKLYILNPDHLARWKFFGARDGTAQDGAPILDMLADADGGPR